MARLDSEDGASSGEITRVGDVGSSTEVSRDTDTLEDVGSGNERLDAGDAESVCAGSDSLSTSGLEGRGQELDVGGLVRADLLEVLVEGGIVTSGRELGLGEVCKSLLVEGVLEVLKGERIVQDLGYGGCE